MLANKAVLARRELPSRGLAVGGPVRPMAAAGSFFVPTVPSGFAHLQMSFSAAHWFREQPTAAIPDGMYFSEAMDQAREALAARAADDWQRFVTARAEDLREGGRLVIQCVGTDRDANGDERVTARELLAAMWAVAVEMTDDGLLDPTILERYVFPVYARTAEEARAPFERADSAFELIDASVAPVPNPYLDAWHQDHDTGTYAHDYAAFVRGFAESALARDLFDASSQGEDTPQGEHAPGALADDFFRRLEHRFAQRPEEDAFRDWTLTIVARRR